MLKGFKNATELDKGMDLVPTDEYTKCVYIPIGVGAIVPPWNFLRKLDSQQVPITISQVQVLTSEILSWNIHLQDLSTLQVLKQLDAASTSMQQRFQRDRNVLHVPEHML